MPKPKPELKLYVWERVLQDYTYGIMFCYAPSLPKARKLLQEKDSGRSVAIDLQKPVRQVKKAEAFVVYGGS